MSMETHAFYSSKMETNSNLSCCAWLTEGGEEVWVSFVISSDDNRTPDQLVEDQNWRWDDIKYLGIVTKRTQPSSPRDQSGLCDLK